MWAPRSRHQAIPGASALCQCTVVSATEAARVRWQPGDLLGCPGFEERQVGGGVRGPTEAAGPSSWRWAAASPAVAAPGSRACAGWQSPMTHVAHFFMTIRLNLA